MSDDDKGNPPRRRSSVLLNPIQLFCLLVAVLLAGTGLVPLEHVGFVLFSAIYMYFLSRFSFPAGTTPTESVFDRNNKILANYVLTGGVVGLFLPVAYILHALLLLPDGGEEAVGAAAPHLFLLSSQVFMEGVSFAGGFSIPVRAFIPVFYNSRRIFSIWGWIQFEFAKVGGLVIVGRALAAANLGFWVYNLFGFLLPVYLPRAFRKYYCSSSA
ncbi:unnamed protein product [Linum tenue]|uniref:DUF7733 domain-containing protein n=1 Tax=Linum tenue TaxID=586396 RepID=A0AAV0QMB4_9ROSI|nr:unnamed protein product [Linum tenue]